jgi:hypothetical protein
MHVIGAETVRIATLADEHPQKISDEPGCTALVWFDPTQGVGDLVQYRNYGMGHWRISESHACADLQFENYHPMVENIPITPGSIDAGLSFCGAYSFHSSEGVCLFETNANPAAGHIAPKGVINSIAASGLVTVPEPDNIPRLKPLR